MSDHPLEAAGGSEREEEASGGSQHPAVTEVRALLDGLDEQPVDEHPAVFERAHEVMRDALADHSNDYEQGGRAPSDTTDQPE